MLSPRDEKWASDVGWHRELTIRDPGVELCLLTRPQQMNLHEWSGGRDLQAYDRILFTIRPKRLASQLPFLRTLPRLVFRETDACQYFMARRHSRSRKILRRLWSRLPRARLLVPGIATSRRLCSRGFDAVHVAKGCDSGLLHDLGRQRDVECGFVGSIGHLLYARRRKFLQALARREKLLITRTAWGQPYLEMLNRIRFFISADMGYGEYMRKNFEAMLCGCVVFAYDQGEEENQALGLEDMVNVVLYRSLDQLVARLARLRAAPELAAAIAGAGARLVRERHSYVHEARRIAAALRLPFPEAPVAAVRRRWPMSRG